PVRQLVSAFDVLAVDRIEQTAGLVAQAERRPHVVDPRNVLELDPRASGPLAEPGEEADGDAHAVAIAREPNLIGVWGCSATQPTRRRTGPPTRPSGARTCAGSGRSSSPTGDGCRRCSG